MFMNINLKNMKHCQQIRVRFSTLLSAFIDSSEKWLVWHHHPAVFPLYWIARLPLVEAATIRVRLKAGFLSASKGLSFQRKTESLPWREICHWSSHWQKIRWWPSCAWNETYTRARWCLPFHSLRVSQQISSYFSRRAAKIRQQLSNDADIRASEQGDNFARARGTAMAITLQHPITFDHYDICAMAKGRSLNRLKLSMLQSTCRKLELEVPPKAIRR